MKHPTCDFTLKNVHEVSNEISCELTKGNAFSLIRLGDAEGLLMSVSNNSADIDIKYFERHFGDHGRNLEDLLSLRNRLMQSIEGADFIGIRNDILDVTFDPNSLSLPRNDFLEHARTNFRLRDAEKNLDYQGLRRIAFLHKSLSNLDLNNNKRFCSAWFQFDYHNSGEIFRLLKQQDRIGLISCRSELPGMLEEMFEVSVKFHKIPDMFRDLSSELIVPDYINQLEDILSQRLVEFPGMLYLIGAGLYGKLYCQLAKSQGGVALDLGSLLDAWVGIASRPTVYKSLYAMEDETGLPTGLALTLNNVNHLLQTQVGE